MLIQTHPLQHKEDIHISSFNSFTKARHPFALEKQSTDIFGSVFWIRLNHDRSPGNVFCHVDGSHRVKGANRTCVGPINCRTYVSPAHTKSRRSPVNTTNSGRWTVCNEAPCLDVDPSCQLGEEVFTGDHASMCQQKMCSLSAPPEVIQQIQTTKAEHGNPRLPDPALCRSPF